MSDKPHIKPMTDENRLELDALRTRINRLRTGEEEPEDVARCAEILHKFKNEFTVTELRLECRRAGIPIPHLVSLN
jgi:hypothetical protein